MTVIVFQQAPSAADRHQLVDSITRLGENETLTLKSSVPIDHMLEEIKNRRFQGLSWTTKNSLDQWEFLIRNDAPEDCCGCCGGGDS